jgi:hypothetical protein
MECDNVCDVTILLNPEVMPGSLVGLFDSSQYAVYLLHSILVIHHTPCSSERKQVSVFCIILQYRSDKCLLEE